MSELDHFVVYKTNRRPVYIAAHSKCVGISAGAFVELGKPEFVNVFIDESGKRVMIKKADKKMPNIWKVIEHRAGQNRCICSKPLTAVIREMFGHGTHITGHPVDGGMIFDRPEEAK